MDRVEMEESLGVLLERGDAATSPRGPLRDFRFMRVEYICSAGDGEEERCMKYSPWRAGCINRVLKDDRILCAAIR
jgi:hypothetical protein